jgi:hypothetical protein
LDENGKVIYAGTNQDYQGVVVCSQNALKFAYVHLLNTQIFRGIPRTPVNRGRGGSGEEARGGEMGREWAETHFFEHFNH